MSSDQRRQNVNCKHNYFRINFHFINIIFEFIFIAKTLLSYPSTSTLLLNQRALLNFNCTDVMGNKRCVKGVNRAHISARESRKPASGTNRMVTLLSQSSITQFGGLLSATLSCERINAINNKPIRQSITHDFIVINGDY